MKKILYLFSLVILLFSNDIKASHYVGYDMTLISLGNDLYKLRAVAYRDARPNTAGFPSSMNFSVYVNGGTFTNPAPIPNITVNNIKPGNGFTPVTYDPKDCPPPGANLLLEKYVYESAAINLSSFNALVGYYVTYTTCCRNLDISNVQNPGNTGITFTMEFPRLNSTAPTRFNSSPVFNNLPLISYIVGKLYTQDWSAVDPNGDSLIYKMAQSRDQNTSKPFTLINFAPGYKLDSNIADGSPDFNINSQTGIITYKPNNIGRYLISIRVEEWKRKSGSSPAYKIGEITREFQIVNVYYPETPPVLTHINSISSLIRDTINVKDTTTYFNRFLSKEQTGDSVFMKLVPEQGVYNNIFNSALFDVKFGKVGDTISSGTAINGLIISGKDSLKTNFIWKIDSTDIKSTPYKFKVISYDNSCPSPLADTLEVELFVFGKCYSTENATFSGCDSVIDLFQRIHFVSTTRVDTIKGIIGCDVIYTQIINVNKSLLDTVNIEGCESVLALDGNYYYNNTTIKVRKPNPNKCDSIITQNIVVYKRPKAYQISGDAIVNINSELFYTDTLQIGAQYVWEVINGVILSGQGTNIIKVRWSNYGSGKVKRTVYYNKTSCSANSQLNIKVCGTFTNQPTNQSAIVNQNAMFSVTTQEPNVTYRWQTDMGLGFQYLTNAGQYTGAMNNTLIVSNLSMTNNNQKFRCIVTSSSCPNELISETATLFVDNNLSVGNINNSNIKIYPNPTDNIINIEGLNKNENNTIQIFDVQGKLVITKTITENGTIDLSELNKGVYVIKIGEVAQRIVKM